MGGWICVHLRYLRFEDSGGRGIRINLCDLWLVVRMPPMGVRTRWNSTTVRELPDEGFHVRREYITQQQQQHGRQALAVLPIHYPKELLTAMNILAVELWGPPGKPWGPDAGRIQTYVCAVCLLYTSDAADDLA